MRSSGPDRSCVLCGLSGTTFVALSGFDFCILHLDFTSRGPGAVGPPAAEYAE